MLPFWLLHRQLLDVLGHDDARDGPLGQGYSNRPVNEGPGLQGVHDRLHVFMGHVLEEGTEIDFLLIVSPHGEAGRLSDNRHDRLVIHLGVVEAVEQMDGPRPGGGHAQAHLTGELGVGTGHEGRHLLVTGLDEADGIGFVRLALQGSHQAVDAITGKAVDASYAPLLQPIDHEIADRAGHDAPLSLWTFRIGDGRNQGVFSLS